MQMDRILNMRNDGEKENKKYLWMIQPLEKCKEIQVVSNPIELHMILEDFQIKDYYAVVKAPNCERSTQINRLK